MNFAASYLFQVIFVRVKWLSLAHQRSSGLGALQSVFMKALHCFVLRLSLLHPPRMVLSSEGLLSAAESYANTLNADQKLKGHSISLVIDLRQKCERKVLHWFQNVQYPDEMICSLIWDEEAPKFMQSVIFLMACCSITVLLLESKFLSVEIICPQNLLSKMDVDIVQK